MELVNYKHPLLNKKLDPIENPNMDELRDIADQLYTFVDEKGGAGVSANQVGIDKRMFVVKWKEYKQTFINPQLTWQSDKNLVLEEGCLTFKDVFIGVKRPDSCRVTYTDYDGNLQEEQLFVGITNRIILHEYDHMEGKFFFSNLSKLQRQRFDKKMLKKYGKVA